MPILVSVFGKFGRLMLDLHNSKEKMSTPEFERFAKFARESLKI
jgi:hypothetical protein